MRTPTWDSKVRPVTASPSSPGTPRTPGPPPPLLPPARAWAGAQATCTRARLTFRGPSAQHPAGGVPPRRPAVCSGERAPTRLPFQRCFVPGGSNGSASSVRFGRVQAPGFGKPQLQELCGNPVARLLEMWRVQVSCALNVKHTLDVEETMRNGSSVIFILITH